MIKSMHNSNINGILDVIDQTNPTLVLDLSSIGTSSINDSGNNFTISQIKITVN
jgi:hypothetical protein